jgi:N-acetylglucosaminyldiphosphoundecaprenol N-acetyl-beta-D-mannosaminyltransferase
MLRKTVDVLGVKIDAITKEEILERLSVLMEQKNKSILATVNSEFIIKTKEDLEFRKILNDESKINLADGIGVLWSAKFLQSKKINPMFTIFKWFGYILLIPFFPKYFRQPIPERISGADFIWDIARFAAKNKYKIFLAGGAPTIAERTALILQTEIPELRIAGIHSGKASDVIEIVTAINKSHADILILAYGAPKQEKWLSENLKKTNCRLGIGLGGTFDFVAGERLRAPKFIQDIGLEWFFRLIQEPSRFGRQLSIPKIMWLSLLKKLEN